MKKLPIIPAALLALAATLVALVAVAFFLAGLREVVILSING